MKILAFVSGSADQSKTLDRLLRRRGFEVVHVPEQEASPLQEAVRSADLTIVNLGRVARDEQFRRRLGVLRNLARAGVPVIAAVGERSDNAVAQVAKAGALDYVQTPWVIRDLLHHLQYTLIRTSRMPPIRGPSVAPDLSVPLGELHDASGRIDASALASYLDIPLARLAEAIEVKYTTLHRTPAAESAQPSLRPIKRVLELLHDVLRDTVAIRTWLRTPRPELEGDSPLDTILAGESEAVVDLLTGSLMGVPA